jgi:hypothetical protein
MHFEWSSPGWPTGQAGDHCPKGVKRKSLGKTLKHCRRCIPELRDFGRLCVAGRRPSFRIPCFLSLCSYLAAGGRGRPRDRMPLLRMAVWQGMAKDSLNYRYVPPCRTLLRPAGGPPMKRSCGYFRGGMPTGQAACGRILPCWTPHAVRL